MTEESTTFAVQRCLNMLDDEPGREAIVRTLIGRAARHLQFRCGSLLQRSYRRLTRPPLNLSAEDLLGAVVERLLKALREVRPQTVRQFFALANQHIRWELNDLARRLDAMPAALDLPEELAAPADNSTSGLTAGDRRLLEAIGKLPEEEREVFDLVRLQGLTQGEVAEVIGVGVKTVQRRLHRALLLLAESLHDLAPPN